MFVITIAGGDRERRTGVRENKVKPIRIRPAVATIQAKLYAFILFMVTHSLLLSTCVSPSSGMKGGSPAVVKKVGYFSVRRG